MPDQKQITSTSQEFLDIYDITNNIVIMKNGSAAVVLTVNAMNFGLLAEQEQDAVIYSYAGLLNSINYPIQILIQSQTKDASAYLKLLDKQEEKSTDEVKRAWIRRYSQFVSNLIKERNVLDKKFFVVIPASSLEMGLTPAQDLISGFKEQTIEGVEKSIILEKAQNLLEPKKDHMIAQFNRIGLYARQLSTQEIIRLFYTNYNPEATEGQQITNSQSYTTAMVQAQIRGDYMNDQSQNPMNSAPAADQPVAPTDTPAPAAPVAPATPAATPAEPVTPAEVPASEAPATPKISESPAVQQPVSVGEAPVAAAPVTPMTPPPVVPQETVEITQPEAAAKPMTDVPSESTMPKPTQPMGGATPASGMPSPEKPAMPATPNPLGEKAAQEELNKTLNQIPDKPTQ